MTFIPGDEVVTGERTAYGTSADAIAFVHAIGPDNTFVLRRPDGVVQERRWKEFKPGIALPANGDRTKGCMLMTPELRKKVRDTRLALLRKRLNEAKPCMFTDEDMAALEALSSSVMSRASH